MLKLMLARMKTFLSTFGKPLRLYILLALIGGGVYLAVWIGYEYGPEGGTDPLYSPLAFGATLYLWVFHVAIQYFTRRQVEYLLVSFSVVLFIQAFTILIILLARADITGLLSNPPSDESPPLWALLVLSISTLTLLALVVGQAVVIAGIRTYQRATIDQFISHWFAQLSQDDCRKLVAVKNLVPVDLGSPQELRELNGYPEIWLEIEGLLPQGVPPSIIPQNDRDKLLSDLGENGSQKIVIFRNIYWAFGGAAVIFGSWVIVFGTVFI